MHNDYTVSCQAARLLANLGPAAQGGGFSSLQVKSSQVLAKVLSNIFYYELYSRLFYVFARSVLYSFQTSRLDKQKAHVSVAAFCYYITLKLHVLLQNVIA